MLVLFSVACGGGLKRVPEPLLASASPDALLAVKREKGDLEEASRSAANARLDLSRAEFARFRAEQALDEVVLELRGVERVAEEADRLGLTQLARENAARAQALRLMRTAAEEELRLAKDHQGMAELTLELREAQRNLADAEFEFARAQAARSTTAPAAQNLALTEYQGQLAEAHAEVADVQSDITRQTTRVQKSKDRLAKAEADLPPEIDPVRELTRVTAERDRLQARVDLLATQVVDLHERLSRTGTSTAAR